MKRLAHTHDEKAQGVIEFAIIISVLMLIFLGVVDYSRFLYYSTAIRSAARVGAETASNHCPSALSSCTTLNNQGTATSDAYVMQATVCEAGTNVGLQPAISCTACITSACSSSQDPCTQTAGISCSSCAQDVCVSPSGSRTQGAAVTVTVGYTFVPISPLMKPFFPTKACWDSDSNGHTLCASSVGRVS